MTPMHTTFKKLLESFSIILNELGLVSLLMESPIRIYGLAP